MPLVYSRRWSAKWLGKKGWEPDRSSGGGELG